MKKVISIVVMALIFLVGALNNSAFGFSKFDRPETGHYFGYFLNETDCLCYVEFFIDGIGPFKLSPVREPHDSANTEDWSARQAWLKLGLGYHLKAVLLNELGDTLGEIYAIVELDEDIKNPPTKEEQEKGITGWAWAIGFKFEKEIFSLELGGINKIQ